MIALIVFRPLRLFLSGVELRHARIVLLKATHWPYVAAIYAFEGAKHRLNLGSEEEGLYASRSRSHKRPLLADRNCSTPKLSRYSASKNRSEASLSTKSAANESRTTQPKDRESVVELQKVKAMTETLKMQETLDNRLRTQESMIQKLSEQVEELTRRLAKPEDGQT